MGEFLEEYIGGKTGSISCCDVCGDNEDRTLEFANTTYETVPAKLIIGASLRAVSDMLLKEPY